jgi:hypothetical protein
MRILSYILIAAGILLLASAGYDEFRGVTHAPSRYGGRYSIVSRGWSHEILTKKGKPEDFHNAMVYHWFYASMLLCTGFILFMIDKGQDSVDPMSPDSDEKIDDELRKDDLDEEMKKEKEQHEHPEL